MGSIANVDATLMELTACRVSLGVAGSEVDLGGTHGGVKVKIKYMGADIFADQTGKARIDRSTNGFEAQVEFELLQIKDKDIWAIAFPHATQIVNGTDKAIDFKSSIGSKDTDHVKSLILHPLSMDDADLSMDYNFANAVASAETEVMFSNDGQQKLKVVMNIYPDADGKYMRLGDPSLVAG